MMLSGIRSKAHHRGDCHPLQNSGNLWRSGGLGEALNYPHQASLFFTLTLKLRARDARNTLTLFKFTDKPGNSPNRAEFLVNYGKLSIIYGKKPSLLRAFT